MTVPYIAASETREVLIYKRPTMSLLNFTKLCAMFAVVAGVLEVIGSLRLFDAASLTTELIYIATDLCLLLGFLAWHLHQQEEAGTLGLIGFLLAFLATGFIAGPSATLMGVPAYTIGAPIVVLGTLAMAINSLQNGTLNMVTPLVFIVFAVVAVMSQVIPILYEPVSFPNLVMGLGFILLGLQITQGRRA